MPSDHPDVLVLAGGGVLGEAWMQGVLAGYEDATGHDFRQASAWVGTSAGSIVAATLAAGKRPRRPGAPTGDTPGTPPDPARQSPLRRLAAIATEPLAPIALAAGVPGGAAVRALALARVGGGTDALTRLRREVDAAGARFDGRLRIVTVDRGNGRRVVFGAPDAPEASVGEAVQASCSIPGVFRPVEIGGREYVDGGAWSLTNLDVAPVRAGQRVLCLNPSMGLDLALAGPLGALRSLVNAATALEAAALRRKGARVQTVGPSPAPAELMAPSLMDGRRAAPVLAGGYAQGRALGGEAAARRAA